jgi:hypothetical protein
MHYNEQQMGETLATGLLENLLRQTTLVSSYVRARLRGTGSEHWRYSNTDLGTPDSALGVLVTYD